MTTPTRNMQDTCGWTDWGKIWMTDKTAPTQAQIVAARIAFYGPAGVGIEDRMAAALAAAAEFVEPQCCKHDWKWFNEQQAATIERCARVVEMYGLADVPTLQAIAAAIRKLKDKPPLDPNIVYPGKDPDFVFPEE